MCHYEPDNDYYEVRLKSQNVRMAGLCAKEENWILLGVLIPMFLPPLQLMKDRSYTRPFARRTFKSGLRSCYTFIISKHCRRSYKKQRCETSNGENLPDSNLLILSNQVDGLGHAASSHVGQHSMTRCDLNDTISWIVNHTQRFSKVMLAVAIQ